MKSFILAILTFCFTLSQSFAQSPSFEEGIFNLSFGAGFPNTTHAAIDGSSTLFSIEGEETGSSTPLFIINGVYGLTENVGIGFFGGYFTSDSEIIATGTQVINVLNTVGANIQLGENFGTTKYSVFTLGGKFELHEQLFRSEKIDTYVSTYLGYNFVTDDFDSVSFLNADEASYDVPILGTINVNDLLQSTLSNANYPTTTYDVNAGLRYSISENFSIYGEAGYGRFLANLGLTFSL